MTANIIDKKIAFIILPSISLLFTFSCVNTKSYVIPSHEEMNSIKVLAVTVHGEPTFTHIGAVNSETTGLVIAAGLVGAITDTVSRQNEDKEIAKKIETEGMLANGRQEFVSTLIEQLQQSKHFKSVKLRNDPHAPIDDVDTTLDVQILHWGTRQKKSSSDIILPFMDIKLSMVDQRNRECIWSETQTIIYDADHAISDYKAEEDLIANDFKIMTQKAGKQITELLLGF